jgi:hypothetical protein
MDTGAAGHFFKVSRDLDDVTPTSPSTSIHFSLPNGDTITNTHTGNLRIPGLPLSARQSHVSPNLASNSLLLIVQMCAHHSSPTTLSPSPSTTPSFSPAHDPQPPVDCGPSHHLHLLTVLQQLYTITTDWTGSLYPAMHMA